MDFNEIYRLYAIKIKRYFIYLTHNNDLAEELLQETFYRAYKSIDHYNGSCKMITWLYGIAKNCWLEHLRRSKKNQEISLESMIPEIPTQKTPEDQIIADEAVKRIFEHTGAIPEPYGEILRLRLFEGMSYSEISEIYGKTENWVRVTFFRAKIKLAEELKKHEDTL
ncbi:MAG: sigma-70 family RNA polymerase sigma factor [Clostridia bacterium]|nr:sigma-70 family RNA polymerase sigma factor [Clostridia bacterium]